MPVPGCFDYSSLLIQFDIRYCDPSYFVLSQNCYNYSGSFTVPYTILKCLFCICEISLGTLIGENGHHKQINKQLLERMCRKGDPSALLVGMQTGAAIVENSMEFLPKTKNGTSF